jgi:hypothetical protein
LFTGVAASWSFGAAGWWDLWGELTKRGKGTRGMPWRRQAMKDVASCDKPWGGARTL